MRRRLGSLWHADMRQMQEGIALDATRVAALRGPPRILPLFEEACLSAANDG